MKKKHVNKLLALLGTCVVAASSIFAGTIPAAAADWAAEEAPAIIDEDFDILPEDAQETLTGTDEAVYVLMNIPYAEFYAAEGDDSVDAVSSATKNKPRTKTLSGGSYHCILQCNLLGSRQGNHKRLQ